MTERLSQIRDFKHFLLDLTHWALSTRALERRSDIVIAQAALNSGSGCDRTIRGSALIVSCFCSPLKDGNRESFGVYRHPPDWWRPRGGARVRVRSIRRPLARVSSDSVLTGAGAAGSGPPTARAAASVTTASSCAASTLSAGRNRACCVSAVAPT